MTDKKADELIDSINELERTIHGLCCEIYNLNGSGGSNTLTSVINNLSYKLEKLNEGDYL